MGLPVVTPHTRSKYNSVSLFLPPMHKEAWDATTIDRAYKANVPFRISTVPQCEPKKECVSNRNIIGLCIEPEQVYIKAS